MSNQRPAPGPQLDPTSTPPRVRRADLHCHSKASTEAGEAVLVALNCPESYSDPDEVYDQAKSRGMDFVTVTDHDSIEGVRTLLGRPDVLVGEELTCYFPEDGCKMHVLVWGLTARDHAELQSVAKDIYRVAAYIADRRLAHSVAHPVYRQNDLLERWHLERLILLFKGFETLNGAHSNLHREAFEPMLDDLTPEEVVRLSSVHQMVPLWPEPHVKSRTGGSDDHGLFNIGRTWTEFPEDAATIDDVLECLRTGRCRPGGEAGSSLKLAHNFFGVGARYFTRQVRPAGASPELSDVIVHKLVGDKLPYRRRDLAKLAVKEGLKAGRRKVGRLFRKREQKTGVALLADLFAGSLRARAARGSWVRRAFRDGRAPLAEHVEMFALVCGINRDVAAGVAESIASGLDRGELGPVFDALSTVVAHQFFLAPYYFALFHQNRERRVLTRVTGYNARKAPQSLKVGVFTDTFDEANGVARFVRDLAAQADQQGRSLVVHTCGPEAAAGGGGGGDAAPSYRKHFAPLFSRHFAGLNLTLNIPPVAEVLEWADRCQFDAVQIDTPGPMGLCGLLVAKMLRVPVLMTCHFDLADQIAAGTDDHRLTVAAQGYAKWLYGQAATVFCRTRHDQARLRATGIPVDRLPMLMPGVNVERFNPSRRDVGVWERFGVRHARRLLFCGHVSRQKNLPLLAEAYQQVCARRGDAALVVCGDGPYLAEMKRALAGTPARFLGHPDDATLAALYASADLFVFPSRTDTLSQVVVEAQACGLPVLVSSEGGPKEVMDDDITGRVLSPADASAWADAIDALLDDEPRRLRMSRTAVQRVRRFRLSGAFNAFWDEHVKAAQAAVDAEASVPPAPSMETRSAVATA